MDPDAEVDFDFSPFLIRYKSGRVRRLMGTSRVAAGTDTATGVTSKDIAIDTATGSGLAARLYIPTDVLDKPGEKEKLPLLVYFHGGAFAVHSAFSGAHFPFLNALVSAARVVAVSVDYRLAPEHPVPAAYDDAWAALRWAVAAAAGSGSGPPPGELWLSEHGDAARLFVAGDSAGANIAHNMALRAGSVGDGGGGGLPGGARIEGMVLLHPYFRGEKLVPSEGTDPKFLERAKRTWGFVSGGKFGLDHPFINPVAMPAAEWAKLGCRRALVTVAGLDTLRDRGRRYVEALRGGGAWDGEDVVLYETEGEGHVYFIDKSGGGGEKAKKEMAAVVSFINRQS